MPKNHRQPKPQPPGTFGYEFRRHRLREEYERTEVSEATGLSYSRLASLEYNKIPERISFENALKLSDLLDWDIKDIAKAIRRSIKCRNECDTTTKTSSN